MASVKTLADFYKSQNALAVQAAGTTASLKAAAQRQRAAISSQEKMERQRLRQTEQLEKMRQQLELQRDVRNKDFEARKFTAQQLAEDARAKFSAAANAEQTEREAILEKDLEKFKQSQKNKRAQLKSLGKFSSQDELLKQQLDLERSKEQLMTGKQKQQDYYLDQLTTYQDKLAALPTKWFSDEFASDEAAATARLYRNQIKQLEDAARANEIDLTGNNLFEDVKSKAADLYQKQALPQDIQDNIAKPLQQAKLTLVRDIILRTRDRIGASTGMSATAAKKQAANLAQEVGVDLNTFELVWAQEMS